MGLYLAILLGYGPPTMKDVLMLLSFRELPHFRESLQALPFNLKQWTEKSVTLLERVREFANGLLRKREVKEAPTEEQDASRNIDAILKGISQANISDLLDDESDEIEMVAPQRELFDDNLADILKSKGTESWFMGEKHVETSILKLNSVIMKSGIFSAELDRRLRAARGSADVSMVKTSMEELRDDCVNYLTAQAELTEKMKNRIDEFGELSYLVEEIEYSNMEQAAQIETTINNIDCMNPEETEETVSKLLKELSKLRLARHRLQDQQEKGFLTMVRYENRMDMIAPQLFVDEISGLRCRIGLEVTLFDWWKQKRQESRQICFALLDLVKFGETNEEHGIIAGNKVIAYMGDLMEKAFSSQDLTGIYYGNCFFIVTVNVGLRRTVAEVEKIRQGLERTNFTFLKNNQPFSLKITSVVTEALPKHTDQDMMKMMEKLIVQAKKMERGVTYLLDQGKLNPELEKINSPDLGMNYISVELDAI